MSFLLDPIGTRDLAPFVLDEHWLPRVMPAAFYADTTVEERGLLGHRYGLYCLPTIELVDWLRDFIAGRKAIEIGAGHGRIAEALGIPATDAFLQDKEQVREYYELLGQPVISYGPNVEHADARKAIRRHRPDVVIGAWITHRYNARQHSRGGNMYGPDTDMILRLVDQYVLIGNEKVHRLHPLWKRPHDILYPDWLYSRAVNGSRDFIAVWQGEQ